MTVLVDDSDDSDDDPSLDHRGFFCHREISFRVNYQRMNDYEKDKKISSSIPKENTEKLLRNLENSLALATCDGIIDSF